MTTTPQRQTKTQSNSTSATTGYEAELWRMADTLRGSLFGACACSGGATRIRHSDAGAKDCQLCPGGGVGDIKARDRG